MCSLVVLFGVVVRWMGNSLTENVCFQPIDFYSN